jgi:hypothetical protein
MCETQEREGMHWQSSVLLTLICSGGIYGKEECRIKQRFENAEYHTGG